MRYRWNFGKADAHSPCGFAGELAEAWEDRGAHSFAALGCSLGSLALSWPEAGGSGDHGTDVEPWGSVLS